MIATPFDFGPLLAPGLPPAAARWTGFPKYNFVGGHIDAEQIPIEELIAAATSVLGREGRTLATYGLESGPQGYLPLRAFLADKLKRYAAIACRPDDILITSGSLQGLDLVNALLLVRGDTVLVEEATYGGALSRIARSGVTAHGVALDGEGMRPDALAAALSALAQRGVRPKYLYTIPTVQNPTGTIMGEERRAELIKLTRAYGVPIVEDECYCDLIWSGRRPAAIYAMGNGSGVIHIGSFSKSIAPALRVGYMVADWAVLSRLLALKTDAGSGALEQMVLAEYCATHFSEHVRVLTAGLRRKLEALMEALNEQFGTAAEFADPPGGIYLWVTLPEAVDTDKLAPLALAAGVAINPGREWTADGALGKRRLRLCFAHPSAATIRSGIAELARVCHEAFGVPARIANVARER